MQGPRSSNSISSSLSPDPQGYSQHSNSRFIQTLIEQLQPDSKLRERLLLIGRENDPQLFSEALLNLGKHLEKQDQLPQAVTVYEAIIAHASEFQSPSHPVTKSLAQERLDAIQGRGASAARIEFLAHRFVKDAIDYKTIVPMLGSTAIFSLVRTAAAAKLSAIGAGIISQGLGLKFASALIGSAVEIPTFALSGRALHKISGDQVRESVSDDLLSAGITLTLLKGFGFAGNKAFAHLHQLNKLGVATRLAGLSKFTQPIISQSFMFGALLTGHKAEEKIGLRAHVDNATTITDTLASMVSMGVGGHLGNQALGTGYAKFQHELEFRFQNAEFGMQNKKDDSSIPHSAFRIPHFEVPALASMAAVGTGLATFLGADLAHAAVHVAEASAEGSSRDLLAGLGVLATGVLAMAAGKRGRKKLSSQQIESTEAKEPKTPLMPEDNGEIEGVGPSQQSASSYTTFIDPKKGLRIGRAPDNDIIISHPEVSDYHAEVDFSHYPNIFVKDLSSSGGTYLRGARLDPKNPGNLRGKHLKSYIKDINIGPIRIDVDLPSNIADFSQVVLMKTVDPRGERWAIKDYSILNPVRTPKKKK